MDAIEWVALLGLALPAYSYVGYPVLLFISAALVQTGRDVFYLLRRGERRTRSAHTPGVSIVMAAYNEEESLGTTLERCLAVDYPPEKLEVIVGSDGSTDGTVRIARQYAERGVRTCDFSERRGKLSVVEDCVERAEGEIVVLTDANTRLQPDSVRKLVRHFDDPEVGAVCGELLLEGEGTGDEGIYWRYEVALKTLENRLNAVLGANGALYAVRRELFPRLPGHLITDDFVIPMKVRERGYRVLYDPEAVAVEDPPISAKAEFRRRLRIGAGNWQALRYCAHLLAPWHGWISLAFWSHKVLRWVTPYLLIAAFCANVFLLGSPFWRFVFAGQVGFYLLAASGWLLPKARIPAGPLRTVTYFVLVNAALGAGLFRGLLGLQRAAWQRTARKTAVTRGDR
ncbi:MAG: glycosyltransferase family 2 protein [Planctomycetota bacterium]